ncbi:hypothetical protein C8034_v007787 [Colletotrichum sidae]|uniref:BTB domain-containing protein n=1 Tax=Colletotrichum sidae TaxID=1347389 RepID=A0A4R8TS58_9PEZI|nr:hypothetical protein C8034_v007787 [Colletotrichum sidae]
MSTAEQYALWYQKSSLTGEPHETVVLDKDGDLILDVGGAEQETPVEASHCPLPRITTARFLVCSKAMARISPVFKAMLYGPYVERKPPTGDWVVKLPEDKPEPMLAMLITAHGLVEKLPYREACEVDDVVNMLILADKYLFTHRVNEWFRDWVGLMVARRPYLGLSIREKFWVLWLALSLGDKDCFSDLFEDVVKNWTTSDESPVKSKTWFVVNASTFPDKTTLLGKNLVSCIQLPLLTVSRGDSRCEKRSCRPYD